MHIELLREYLYSNKLNFNGSKIIKSNTTETSAVAVNTYNDAIEYSNNQSLTQTPNYWAKGTGFGSGTTQQQWNLNRHVTKQRQEEEHITCLLMVC